MKLYNQPLMFVLVGLACFGLLSCGASKSGPTSGSSELESRSVPGMPDMDGNHSGYWAECNEFENEDIDLKGRVTTYYLPLEQKYDTDRIRLKMLSVPEELYLSKTHYIELYRWGVDDSGTTIQNNEPVEIVFQMKATGKILNEDEPVQSLSRNTIRDVIQSYGLDDESVTESNFFDRVILILEGMDLRYDAMFVALYDESQGSGSIGYANVLLPAFDAVPNNYASTHSSSRLQALHPNWEFRDQDYTDSEFSSRLLKYCSGF